MPSTSRSGRFFLLAVLGGVGTYLFADVAIGLIYTREKFGPAADVLRAFVPMQLLMYVDLFLASAIVAAGNAGRLARAKVAAVVVTTGIAFVLVPLCQTRLGNGGLGVMYATGIGELLMTIAGAYFLRDSIDGRTLGDVCRSLVAGVATVLLIQLLPEFTPFLSIPLCIVVFAALSFLFGAAKRSDVEMVMMSFQKRSPAS